MRIDYEYIKDMLDIFQSAPEPTLTCIHFVHPNESQEAVNKYAFHLQILHDKGLVVGVPEKNNLGLIHTMKGFGLSRSRIRLTNAGHEFAINLNKPGVIEFIKEKVKDEGLGAVIDIAKDLGSGYLKKKLGLSD